MSRETPTAERVDFLARLLAFSFIFVIAHYGLVMVRTPEVLAGAQIDTDGYMRLVRVQLLLDGAAGWYDNTIYRSNWPYGESHHWTRPLDVLIVLLYGLFLPFTTGEQALAIAGAVISPLCLFATCVAGLWATKPLIPGPARFLMLPAMLIQPGILEYGIAGRADHHALIYFFVVCALGGWIRVLMDRGASRGAVVAGGCTALGLWVSPEVLLPLALFFLSAGVAWIHAGRLVEAVNVRFAAVLVGTLAVALVLERPPSDWLAAEYDRLSLPHLFVAGTALMVFLLVRALPDRMRSVPSHRFAVGLAAGLVAAVLVLVAFPSFFRGPWVDVDREVISVWLHGVSELQPIFPRRLLDVGSFVGLLGPAFVVVPALVAWIRSDGIATSKGRVWLFLLASLCVYVPLAAAQLRFVTYAGAIFAIVLVELVRRVYGRIEARWSERWQPIPRAGATAALLVGFRAAGLAVAGVFALATAEPADARTAGRGTCPLDRVSGALMHGAVPAADSLVIATFIDFGPELLYRTHHRVLAGPYHRNAAGILDSYSILAGPPAEAERLLGARQVDLLLICPPADSAYFGRGGESSLYRLLRDGTPPDWAIPLSFDDEVSGSFMAFRVNNPRSADGDGFR